MKKVNGDALDLVAKTGGFLFHQTNCQRVAGAGIALQIAERWPNWLYDFRSRDCVLGDVLITQVAQNISIVSLYGQFGFGRGVRQTDYKALDTALKRASAIVGSNNTPKYFPYKMACGVAGGKWEVVGPMIALSFPDGMIVVKP